MLQRYKKGTRMSEAVSRGGLVCTAGQVANDRKAGIGAQTSDVLAKIGALLKEAGADRSKPSRACVEARLADPDRRGEMTAVAALQVPRPFELPDGRRHA
ncbi:RidA family protein [Rhizobium sp. YTU87027]|uniref:RidA family protein n=1 Tax=Rhizobium sp. YTU87027 TaxID=3417741 RepID=UPI003D69915E